jgi:hypothetical protein
MRLDIFDQNADKVENDVETANLMFGENLYGVSVYLNDARNVTP